MSRFAVTAYTVSVEVMPENIIHNENSCDERRADWKNKDSARATGTCCSRMKYKIAEINKKLQNRVDRWRDL